MKQGDVRRHVIVPMAIVAILSGCGSSPAPGVQEPDGGAPANAGKHASPQSVECGAPDSGQAACVVSPGDEVSRLLPADAEVHLAQRGDIDGDGNQDVLVVLQQPGGAQARFEPRTLLVLRRGADGRLEKTLQAPDAILCQACGGMMGDPLQGVRTDTDGFVLHFEGGSREMWSQEYDFRYSAEADTWFLEEIAETAIDRLNGDFRDRRRDSGDVGKVRIEHFDPKAFASNMFP